LSGPAAVRKNVGLSFGTGQMLAARISLATQTQGFHGLLDDMNVNPATAAPACNWRRKR
jgi:hypothetical protein